MKRTIKYLEEAQKATGADSDKTLAKLLGITAPAISQYKKGSRTIDDYTATKIANVLQINPLEIIAAANAEREKDAGRREFWERMARNGGIPPLCIALIWLPMLKSAYVSIIYIMRIAENEERAVLIILPVTPCPARNYPNSAGYAENTSSASRTLHGCSLLPPELSEIGTTENPGP